MCINRSIQPKRIKNTCFLPGRHFQQYQLLEKISAGGTGMVWSAIDQIKNRIVAIKVNELDPENKPGNYLMLDRHMTGLHHPHIIPTYDFGICENIQYCVTPYIPGGSLEDRVHDSEPLSIGEILRYTSEIVSALEYLHAENIIHGDLKPANILFNFNHHLCIADFDLAQILSKTTRAIHTGRGTPAFAPPEQYAMTEITPQSDIFSLGVILYALFTRVLPWKGEKSLGIQQLSSPSTEIPDPREIRPELPAGLVNVLRKMTAANPKDRPDSVRQVRQIVYACFEQEPNRTSINIPIDEKEIHDLNVKELLKNSLALWKTNENVVVPTLTKFALIDQKLRADNPDPGIELQRFMLTHALTYGYQDAFWWEKVENPKDRLIVASQLINKYNDIIAERIIDHLENDRENLDMKSWVPESLLDSILGRAYKTRNEVLRNKILTFLSTIAVDPKI